MKAYTSGKLLMVLAALGLIVPSAPAAPSQREEEFGAQIDEWIPGMAAENIPEREGPQQKLERMCFQASKPGNEADRAALSKALIARCGPETPEIARVWMLRKLEPMGRDEVVKGLTHLLKDDNERIRELARRALMNNPSPRAAESLRAYLESADDNKERVAAINALAWRRDAQSVPMIADLLDHKDDNVVTAAVVALGKVGGPQAAGALDDLLDRIADHPGQRNEIIEASLRSAEHRLQAGKPGEAADVYKVLLADIDDQNIQIAAVHGLVQADPAGALATLIDLIEKGDSRLQLVAIRCAQELEGENVTAELVDALDDAPPATLAMLIDVLGRRGDKAALEAVMSRVTHASEQVRVAALAALEQLGGPESVNVLAECAASTGGIERETARDSLAGLAGDKVNSVIAEAIGSSSGAVRAEFIHAAAARRIAEARPQILKAADDDDFAVRGAVIAALGVLGNEEDLPRLIDLLVQGISDDSRAAAEEAIVTVCERIDDRDRRVEPILQGLRDADSKAKASLIHILGRLQGGKALTTIRAHAASPDPAVRYAVAEALKGWEPTYIDAWLFSGPYRHDDRGPKALFDIAFAPEKGESADWKPLGPKTRQPGRPYVFLLHQAADGENCAGYVKTTIVSPADAKAVLTFGSDDGIKAWLNGEVVHASNEVRGLTLDQERADAALKKGENTLMLKITQGGADWSFCCGVKAPDGGPIEGLKFDAKP